MPMCYDHHDTAAEPTQVQSDAATANDSIAGPTGMRIITLLNQLYHFPGFVYKRATLKSDGEHDIGHIEVEVEPRVGSKLICSGCHKPAPGYDHLNERHFEFIPIWGLKVFFIYTMRRVNCRTCGVKVEELPWATGKHHQTKAHMLFLAHWARKLSWKETAISFHTTWDKVCHAVEYVVAWGLLNRELGSITAIGVDEIQYAKGHKYLTLVYQIEEGCTRLLWVGKDRTIESFEQFFNMIGEPLSEGIQFVCSDMWPAYLKVIKERCSNALNILDRFHIVAKMNDAIDDAGAT
jgi:transposase